jgi:hypothetical protein
MAATRLTGKLANALTAALNAVAGTTAYQGKLRFPDTSNLENMVRSLASETESYCIVWVAERGASPLLSSEVLLRVLIFINLPRHDTSTLDDFYDYVDGIQAAATQDSTWQTLACTCLESTLIREDDELRDNVAVWRLDVRIKVPASCPTA